ncbi:MAG: sulfatase-like hydrolase/transferase [Porphyromonas sp.]|nr:sulfatase-like hydrolase/transferase [Porphyromonas sp.]
MKKILFKTPYRSVYFLYYMSLSFLFFNIGRLVFLVYNYSFYEHLTTAEIFRAWTGGWRFDISAMSYFNLPFVIAFVVFLFMSDRTFTLRYSRNILRWLFFVPNALAIIMNLADSAYFPYVLKRTTATVFSEFAHESFPHLLWQLVRQYYGLTSLTIILVLILWWLVGLIRFRENRFRWTRLGRISLATLSTIFLAFIFLGAMRGGWAHSVRPITLSNASLYVEKSKDRDLVLNTPFCMVRLLGKRVLTEVEYIPRQEAERLFSGIYQAAPLSEEDSLFGAYRGYNVMIIIVESFAKEHIGALQADGYGFTPFIDSMIGRKDVLSFPFAFANGRKSIDAMPSILTSIPALGTNFVTSHYSGSNVYGLPKMLSDNGYKHSMFLHGAPNGSMGFDAFAKQVGFREYYGMDEYPNKADYDGNWGIWDKPFLTQVVQELSRMPSPWMGCVFTLTSHAPFRIPKEDEGRFPLGSLPLHQCIGYTDSALKAFFEYASRQDWYEKTLFVFTADHASQSIRPEYRNIPGCFAVPMLWFAPGKPLTQYKPKTDMIVQQADIYPSINYLLGIRTPIVAFGQNIFDPRGRHYAICFEGEYMLMNGKRLFHVQEDGIRRVETLDTPLLPETDSLAVSENLLPAIIQNFNKRLIHNQLTNE